MSIVVEREHLPLTTRSNKQWLVWHGVFVIVVFVIFVAEVLQIHTCLNIVHLYSKYSNTL